MAHNSTVCRARLSVSDIDRGVYGDYVLTLACHPSETPERLMVRLLAFALNADERLTFGTGLSSANEADLACTDHDGTIRLWIDVGQPDARAMLKACGRSAAVRIYAYASSAEQWWHGVSGKVIRAENLAVFRIAAAHAQALGRLAGRNMQMQCIVQDGQIWFGSQSETFQIEVTALQPPAP